MSLTLGEKLQQAREERGTTIAEVAEQTRISPLYIEAIENNDYRILPGGIFNKGFVKSFAKIVGVDEQEALQDYMQLISQQEGTVSDEPKTYKPEVLTDERANSSSLFTIVFAVIILGLMTWGILSLVNYLQSEQNQTAANNSNKANNPAANTNTNANVSQPLPSMNEIKIEFKPTVEKINVKPIIDGKPGNAENVEVDSPKTYVGQQSVKLSFFKGFADKVQITLNGKQVTLPPAPTKGIVMEFEVNKSNIEQILQSGQITPPATNAGNTNVRQR
jgi:cytoskeletal protein RodZ